jgi:hypothetical protein
MDLEGYEAGREIGRVRERVRGEEVGWEVE